MAVGHGQRLQSWHGAFSSWKQTRTAEEAFGGPFPLLCARSAGAALLPLSPCASVSAAICIPTSVATFSFHSSCVREFQRDKVSGAGSFPPLQPTGTRHPFDQVATCPPTVKRATGESRGRSFPWGVKCPIRSRGLLAEAPGSVWLPGWATTHCLDPPPE